MKHKGFKRSVSILLSAILLIGMLPLSALTAGAAQGTYSEKYWDSQLGRVLDREEQIPSDAIDLADYMIHPFVTLTDGKFYYVDESFTFTQRLTVSGSATLLIKDNVTLNCNDGITIPEGSSLKICSENYYGSGTLNASTESDDCAGIGGINKQNSGSLIVMGGSVYARGAEDGAGIGGGYKGDLGGAVTVYGGYVNAKGGKYGAGIGGGCYGNQRGAVNIYGGTVDTQGGKYGAGIGGGEGGAQTGAINIFGKEGQGGTVVNAVGGEYAAGIGGGQKWHGGGQGGPVNISGGTISAVGGVSAAGIGGGEDGNSGYIRISGGTVSAVGGNRGAGIGGGEDASLGQLEISGGTVRANSYKYGGGSAIGGGFGAPQGGAVKISGGKVTATGIGSGIGGGSGSWNGYDGGYVEITGGEVTAECTSLGAAIGGGGTDSKNGVIKICGPSDSDSADMPKVTAKSHGGAGIGCGFGNDNSQVNPITIENAVVTAACTGGFAAGIGAGGGDDSGGNGGTITIKNSAVSAASTKGAGIGGGGTDGWFHGGKGGNITITKSAVFAISALRGAGIGGGEGGDGGIVIIDDSYVHAVGGYENYDYMKQGKDESITIYRTLNPSVYEDILDPCYDAIVDMIMCWMKNGEFGGAGIGGGHGGKGGFTEIKGASVVLATGGMSSTSAIGHGNKNTEVDGYSLPDNAKVRAGYDYSSLKPVDPELRFDALRDNRCALVETCIGHVEEYHCLDNDYHIKWCKYCHEQYGDPEPHDFGDDGKCRQCGYISGIVNLKIIETNEEGRDVIRTEQAYKNVKYDLPDCTNAPSGQAFVCWKITPDPDNGYVEYGHPGMDYYPTQDVTVTAVYTDLVETDYIDEQGEENTVIAKKLTSACAYLSPGWYVPSGVVQIENLTTAGQVNLILPDNYRENTLVVKDSLVGDSITIFGQKKQTGYLEFRKIAYFDTFSQYGAEVSATGWVSGTGAKKTLTVNNKLTLARGKLSLTNIEGGTVQLLGGNSDLWNMNVNEIILSWTNLSDSYRFVYIDPLPSAGMRVIDGKSLKDNDYEKIFSGTLSTEDITAAQDKTLRPYHPTHSCGEPEWNWADDCSKATATFTCKDCGYTETVETTNIVRGDSTDDEPVYRATVEFENTTYTGETAANYFSHHSLSLDGDIAVNFYVYVPEAIRTDKTEVVFTWEGNRKDETMKEIVVPWNEYIEKDGFYKFSCNVCAAEMNDEITAELYHDGKLLETNAFSVREYGRVILNDVTWIAKYKEQTSDTKYEALATLVKTMLNYGAYAQTQFNHHADEPANEGIGYPLTALTTAEVNAIAGDIPNKVNLNSALEGTGLEYYGYSLLLKTKTSLRFYFRVKGTPDLSKLSLGGESIVQRYNDEFVYIQMVGIPANKLADIYLLQYGKMPLGNYSELSYAKDVLTDTSSDETITNTVTALYRYNEAAVTFFNTPDKQGGGA